MFRIELKEWGFLVVSEYDESGGYLSLRQLTQVGIGASPSSNRLVFMMEAREEGEENPQEFRTALTEEQAKYVLETMTECMTRLGWL